MLFYPEHPIIAIQETIEFQNGLLPPKRSIDLLNAAM